MTIAPKTKVVLADGHTGEVEWTGTWLEFITENEDDEELADVRAKLEKGEPAYVGGGAAAYFKITTERTGVQLTPADIGKPCQNPRQFTAEQALINAITGDDQP